jgi:hypothetical protein
MFFWVAPMPVLKEPPRPLDGVDTVWRVWTPTAEGSYQPGLVFTNEKDALAWADADAQGRA